MAKIPVAAAKRVARAYQLDEVIIIGVDRKNGLRFHATYGKDQWHCDDAANASRVMDLLLSSTSAEEFLLQTKKSGWVRDGFKAEAQHATFEEVDSGPKIIVP